MRTFFFVVLAVMALVPGWSGEQRLALLGEAAVVSAVRVPLDPHDPARRRLGRLVFMGGVSLTSPDPAFGGFSALAVRGDRVTLLSDGGNLVRFTLRSDGAVQRARFGNLPAGPGTGWMKRDRDSEAMAVDPATGQVWIGFERANALWRYAPDFARATGATRPAAMAGWRENGGPESLVRRRDGSFVVIGERADGTGLPGRPGLVFAADPVRARRPAFAFRYLPPPGFEPADAAALPDGRLLVLSRGFTAPFNFSSRVEVVRAGAIRPGARVRGQALALLAAPLIHDNFEGIATTAEQGRTIVWLVSDDNQSLLQRSLLLKFRLD